MSDLLSDARLRSRAARTCVSTIHASGRSLLSLIDDILDLATAAASPSPADGRSPFQAASSLTVAGPRRIRTGLPCYAPSGHPSNTRIILRHQCRCSNPTHHALQFRRSPETGQSRKCLASEEGGPVPWSLKSAKGSGQRLTVSRLECVRVIRRRSYNTDLGASLVGGFRWRSGRIAHRRPCHTPL